MTLDQYITAENDDIESYANFMENLSDYSHIRKSIVSLITIK